MAHRYMDHRGCDNCDTCAREELARERAIEKGERCQCGTNACQRSVCPQFEGEDRECWTAGWHCADHPGRLPGQPRLRISTDHLCSECESFLIVPTETGMCAECEAVTKPAV